MIIMFYDKELYKLCVLIPVTSQWVEDGEVVVVLKIYKWLGFQNFYNC